MVNRSQEGDPKADNAGQDDVVKHGFFSVPVLGSKLFSHDVVIPTLSRCPTELVRVPVVGRI